MKSVPSSHTLAEAVGRVSLAWSGADIVMLIFMQRLLPSDTITAVAVSSALDFSRRRDLLKSLAQLKLQDETRKRFFAYMTLLGGLAKERNAVIHAFYGSDDSGGTTRFNFNNRGVLTAQSTNESIPRLIGLTKKIVDHVNSAAALDAGIIRDVRTWQKKFGESIPSPWDIAEHHRVATLNKP